ncbi:MAG: class I SAM-dependent methyltransferase [Gemmatimonadota bacterium]|nr:class I SAM-dependent methyltransferase [Gemmatimonadota bacterium]
MSLPLPATAAGPHHVRRDCRACGGGRLTQFVDLGPQPLANSLPRSPAEFATELFFPMGVYLCEDCGLVQLVDVIDPELLFRDYVYVTGTSDTIAAHNVGYARTVVQLLALTGKDLVVEVASNDGSLLSRFQTHGVRTLGVEPARNIAAIARAAGIETISEFFNEAAGPAIRASHGPAKVVIGNNVLAHVDEPVGFLRGAAALLEEDGLVITEVPYLREFVDRLEYDTVYHEHLCYFSVSALMRLAERAGLSIIRVDHVPVHGGSIRMYAAKRARHPQHAPAVQALAAAELADGLTTLSRFQRFATDVSRQREALRALLTRLKAEGRTVAGYGAPAKGNTQLNYCGITTDLMAWTVDKSPHKVGRYIPGTHQPILPAAELLARQPDYTVILAWNFAEEIMRQQAEYHARGGKFILPLPAPVIC